MHLGTSTSTIAINGATTIQRQFGHGDTRKKLSLDGIVSGTAGLTLNAINNGFNEGAGLLIGNNANTYSGTVTVSERVSATVGAALIVGGNTALQFATVNNLSSGTVDTPFGLRFNPGVTAPVIGALSGTGPIVLQDLAGTPAAVALTVGGNNSPATYSGILSGAGSFTKIGSGAMTVSGANTYTGNTIIGAGALLANNTTGSATGAGSVTVNSTGTLGGAGFLVLGTGNNVTVNGTLSPGNSPGILSVTGTQTAVPAAATDATLNLASGSTFRLELNSAVVGTGYDQISLVGTASIGGSLLSISLGNGFNPTSTTFVVILNDGTTDAVLGNFANSGSVQATNDLGTYAFTSSTVGGDGNDVVLTAALVPEPSTWGMILGSLGLLVGLQRRRS